MSSKGSSDERILAAAKALILANGYAGTSMDQIALQARVSKTTLYNRHPSKAALFAAVVLERAAVSGMEFEPRDFSSLSIDAALFEIGKRFVSLVCSPGSLRLELVYQSEAVRLPEVAAAFRRAGPEHAIAAVERYFRDAHERGLVDVSDPHFAAVQFLIALKGDPYGIASSRSASPRDENKAAHIRKVVDLFLNGARPRVPYLAEAASSIR